MHYFRCYVSVLSETIKIIQILYSKKAKTAVSTRPMCLVSPQMTVL